MQGLKDALLHSPSNFLDNELYSKYGFGITVGLIDTHFTDTHYRNVIVDCRPLDWNIAWRQLHAIITAIN